MTHQIWHVSTIGKTPVVAVALHAGHTIREELVDLLALSDAERLREEDPFTDQWVSIAETQVVGTHSRFEVDLNRPRLKAVYIQPEDAWGLRVWRKSPGEAMLTESLAEYDAFYTAMAQLFTHLSQRFGRFVVYDLHSYNHRREGPEGAPANPALNPEVNLGTGTVPHAPWQALIERFITDLRAFDFAGRQLDVRKNVKFMGGHFARWTHSNFPEAACVLSIEFKKFFMDEWTGIPDSTQIATITRALQATVPGVLEELNRL